MVLKKHFGEKSNQIKISSIYNHLCRKFAVGLYMSKNHNFLPRAFFAPRRRCLRANTENLGHRNFHIKQHCTIFCFDRFKLYASLNIKTFTHTYNAQHLTYCLKAHLTKPIHYNT